jgi:hypothetical protein
MSRPFAVPTLIAAALGLAAPAAFAEAGTGVVLEPWHARLGVAAGAVDRDHAWGFDLDAWLRLGLPMGLELAAPLALAVALLDDEDGSGLALAAGILDLWIDADRRLLLQPGVALAGRARVGREASLLLQLDFTGAERADFSGEHPGWLRGGVGLAIDLGPWLTVAAGGAYQRRVLGGDAGGELGDAGFAGDARLSLGAVRCQPFQHLPTLSIHAAPWIDVIVLVRADIDTDRGSTDARFLAGLQLRPANRR